MTKGTQTCGMRNTTAFKASNDTLVVDLVDSGLHEFQRASKQRNHSGALSMQLQAFV